MIPDHWRAAALSPPTAWGAPLSAGILRATPEDFVVDEFLGFAASGEGPHALLRVRKRGANTEWVARELARAAGCKPFEIGFAGMKDRNAVTTQFFSVPRGKRAAEDFVGIAGEGYEVIESAAHQRKLPRGALEGNRFDVRIRELTADAAALRARVESIASGGIPNYFGPQRFGRDGGNLAAVMAAAQSAAQSSNGGRGRDRDRSDRGFMLSAARSLVFNAMLAQRVAEGTWNRLLAGDVANLDGRGSVFAVEAPDAELVQRCDTLDIHPTAPLVGDGQTLATGAVREMEETIAARFPEVLALVRAERMNSERRALRMRVRDLVHEYADGVLRLRFSLGAGGFATTVLRELISTATEE